MTALRHTCMLLALCAALAACGRSSCAGSTAPPATPSPAAPSPAAPAAADAAQPPPAAPDAAPPGRDVAGLRVRMMPDGVIRLEGRDQWGGDLTTTYETVDFLERSLPALERSVTAPQLAGLRALVAELRAADAGRPDAA